MTSDDYYALNQANAKRFPTTQIKQNAWTPDYATDYRRRYGQDYRQNMGAMVTDPKSGDRMVKTGALIAALGAGGVFGASLAAGAGAAGAAGGAAGSGSGVLASSAPAASMGSYAAPVAASGTSVGGGGAAAGAGSKFSLGTLLKFGVPLVTNYLGQRSNNKALDRQSQMEQATLAEQIAFAREQEAFRRAEAERVAMEDRRRWEIEQINMAKQLAAAEEERAFNRRLVEEREGRRSQARMRLEDFLRRGR